MFVNKVQITGVNTSKLPVLTNKEKNDLLKKIKERKFRGKRRIYKWKS